jgi:hypothetical protein
VFTLSVRAQRAACVPLLCCSFTGQDFGLPGTFATGFAFGPRAVYFAPRCTVLNHTRMSCVSAPGVGRLHQWVVTVDGQSSAPSVFTTSYLPPSIQALALAVPGARDSLSVLGTAGGDVIAVVRRVVCHRRSAVALTS